VRAVLAADDGRTLVTAGFDSAIIVWDLASGAARRVLRFHEGIVNALAEAGPGCFASGGEDGRIALWCGEAQSPARVLSGHTGPVAALARSPDRRLLASASWDHSTRIWSLDAPDVPARVIDGHTGPVNGVAFTALGSSIATVGYDGQLRLTPLTGGQPVARRIATPLNAVLVDRAGEIVVAGADGRIGIVSADLATVREANLDKGPLTTLALSPDGVLLATAGMRTPVTLLDRTSLTRTAEILGPGLPVWSLAFAGGNGRPELFTGGADHAVRRWNPASARPSGAAVAAEAAPEPKDGERGAVVFRACRACHDVSAGASNRAGPSLHGLFGRRIASAPGYAYSEALKRLDIVWTAETVTKLFEVGPTIYTPGTKMPEQRVTDPDDLKALIGWLEKVTR
jgi:cytochrome c